VVFCNLACTWRGAGSPLLTAYCPLVVYLSCTCQRAAEDGFCGGFGSVSGDGHSFRYCTVGELLRDCDCVSVMAAQEKCDDKNARSVGQPPVASTSEINAWASRRVGKTSLMPSSVVLTLRKPRRVRQPKLGWGKGGPAPADDIGCKVGFRTNRSQHGASRTRLVAPSNGASDPDHRSAKGISTPG
jgi:hypothetical protein